jgi:hypothetical protein
VSGAALSALRVILIEAPHSPFPRKRESGVFALLAQRGGVARFRPPRRRPSYFSLLVQREVAQRKHARLWRRTSSGALRCSPASGRCELAHPCAQTCAPFPRARLRCSVPETGGRSSARAKGHSSRLAASGAHDARRSWVPSGAVRRGRSARRGAGTRPARFPSAQGRAVGKPGPDSRTWRAGCPEGATAGCPSLWLLSLGHARESNSAAAEADETLRTTRIERVKPRTRHWISAFAGMTKGETVAGMTRPRR